MRAQTVLLVLSAALLTGCGIKGPLHPPPTLGQLPDQLQAPTPAAAGGEQAVRIAAWQSAADRPRG